MSRIGKKPIAIPAGIDVKIDGNVVTVKGGNVTLEQSFRPEIKIEVENGEIIVSRPDDTKEAFTALPEPWFPTWLPAFTPDFPKSWRSTALVIKPQKMAKILL